MKKLILIMFLFMAVFAHGQDTKPAGRITLQSPNNVVFDYNTSDSTIGMWKGTYKWNKMFSAKQVQHKLDSLKILADAKYGNYYRNEVTVAGTTSYALPYTLRTKSQVWYNGILLRPEQWSGVGTIYISISCDIKLKDYITIIF